MNFKQYNGFYGCSHCLQEGIVIMLTKVYVGDTYSFLR